jgi:hypothetical protein
MTERAEQPMTKTTFYLPAELVLAAKERALKESRGGERVTLRDIAEKAIAGYLRTAVVKKSRKG